MRASVTIAVAVLLLPWCAGGVLASPEGALGGAVTDFPTPSPALAKRVASLIERVRVARGVEERQALVDQLVDMGPDAIPVILAELDRRSRATWAPMILTLGSIGDSRVIPILEKEAERQTGIVLQELLYALALAGDDSALVRALRSSGALMQFDPGATAIDFIAGSMGTRAVPILVQEIPRRSQDARAAGLSALATISDDGAVDFLLKWSRQQNAVDRRYSVIALARIGDPRGRSRVVEALKDPDPDVREAAVEGVGWLRDAGAVPQLVEILADPRPSTTRYHAIWSLGLIGGPAATRALIEVLRAAPPQERPTIAQALGNTGDAAAAETLAALTLGGDPILAAAAANGLVKVRAPTARDALLEVACQASDAEVAFLASRECLKRRDQRAVPCVIKRIKESFDAHQGIGPHAEALLTELQMCAPSGAADMLDALAESVSSPATEHRLRSVALGIRTVHDLGPDLNPWIELLEKGTPGEVDLAVHQVGELGDQRAIEPLRRLFGRIDPERAHRIPEALGRIGSDRATPFLVSLLSDDLYRVPSLDRAREEAVRALAAYSRADAAAAAVRTEFIADRGRSAVPLMAYARMRGLDGIKEIVELKALLLRRRGADQVARHERINWALRLLRSGREIDTAEVRDGE